jgi:DNA-binding winged helix-turn-helix (wHTH) protein
MESYLPDFAWSVVADQTSNSHRAVLPRCYSFGAFELDVLAHVLCRNGIERHLEPRGFDVLLYLLMNRDRVVSKNELLEELWPTRHVTENVVARCVMKVRQTLDDRGSRQPLIRTIHRIGYRFVASAVESNQPSVILSRSPMLVRN